MNPTDPPKQSQERRTVILYWLWEPDKGLEDGYNSVTGRPYIDTANGPADIPIYGYVIQKPDLTYWPCAAEEFAADLIPCM